MQLEQRVMIPMEITEAMLHGCRWGGKETVHYQLPHHSSIKCPHSKLLREAMS